MAATVPSKLFIDSSAFIALFFQDDVHHEPASSYYGGLTRFTRLFTTIFVVSETYTWLRYHVAFSEAAEFLDVIDDALRSGWLDIDPGKAARSRKWTVS